MVANSVIEGLKKAPLYRMVGFTLCGIKLSGAIFILLMLFAKGIFDFNFLLFKTFVPLCFFLAIAFFLTGLWEKSKLAQPAILLVLMAFSLIEDPTEYISLVYFVLAISLLIQYGFFKNFALLKILSLVFLFLLLCWIGSILNTDDVYSIYSLPFVTICLTLALYVIFHEQINPIIFPQRQTIYLKSYNLSHQTESILYLVFVKGLSRKEASGVLGIPITTLSNKITATYDTFGLEHSEKALVIFFTKNNIIFSINDNSYDQK